MSSSSRLFAESDGSKVDLPVFITPHELVFSVNKRRTILVIYNPYGNDAQYRIMTTNPERFDVSHTKGTIRPNRRIDITIRLVSNKTSDLPEPTDELQLIDHFRISMQVASLRGNRQVKVHWVATADYSDTDDLGDLSSQGSRSTKLKRALMRQTGTSSAFLSTSQRIGSGSGAIKELGILQQGATGPLLSARSSSGRPTRSQMQDHLSQQNGTNVNLVCFLGAIFCVVLLFLPMAIDSELCKKAKLYSDSSEPGEPQGLLGNLGSLLSVSYEMKFGCSFALGLFTYRLISTMPD